MAGLLPILLPLFASRAGNPTYVGLVMAAVSLGGLTAPLWGSLADRYRLHRLLLAGGALVTAMGLAASTLARLPAVEVALALVLGIGTAAAGTVANLFVVEFHPQPEWDERIGWLQTFYGAGQVAGLLVAGFVGQGSLRGGLWIAAGLSGLAAGVGWLTTHPVPASPAAKPLLRHPVQNGEWAIGSPQRLFHHADLRALQGLGPALRSPFGLFLAVWLLAFGSAAAFFAPYPVLMQRVYGIGPAISAAGFAIAAGCGLALYSPAGRWSDRFGPARVLQLALVVRLLAFAGLLVLGFLPLTGRAWLALLGFALVVLAWSVLSVSSTALAANLSPVGEGTGLGIFNAATAVAGVLGAVVGGWAAGRWGYNAIPALALAGIALGLFLSVATQRKKGTHKATRAR